ncbi:hypothetical protein [Metabacillus arenae]|uniref:Uncharacterized protein n=1 Tax=Metabacillus arenae TaxID=2771434 RepID=A0A926N963_9BACI|nr:hypothetical protein [Metabacillus arenae]MBD1379034.1 hypothetical protein [Metabacillus arenae]
MNILHFIQPDDYQLIHFSFSLIAEIDQKIKDKKLFYENQILDYVNSQIECFLKTCNVKQSLKVVYKAELYQLMKLKLNELFNKYTLLKCY